ncbi:hypothetical protein DO72_5727 [Burkholderia pseudomallei]|nr:hypothetical protein DO70_5301 [Burkholderia pseudomallei]KGD43927.1 hypothetical protein DO72_5727 [Burkholderia pseudomallei]
MGFVNRVVRLLVVRSQRRSRLSSLVSVSRSGGPAAHVATGPFVQGDAQTSPASTCATCSTRVSRSPVRRSRPSMFSMQPRSPSTTAPAPVARTFAHFSSTIAVEMSPYFTANVPPKPQQCSQSFISATATPRCASSARGCAFTPSSRRPEHESWYVTGPLNAPGSSVTRATLTRKSVSS